MGVARQSGSEAYCLIRECSLRRAAQFIEQQFFAYADQKASDALYNHLGIAAHSWTSELVSAWSRFVISARYSRFDPRQSNVAMLVRLWCRLPDRTT